MSEGAHERTRVRVRAQPLRCFTVWLQGLGSGEEASGPTVPHPLGPPEDDEHFQDSVAISRTHPTIPAPMPLLLQLPSRGLPTTDALLASHSALEAQFKGHCVGIPGTQWEGFAPSSELLGLLAVLL